MNSTEEILWVTNQPARKWLVFALSMSAYLFAGTVSTLMSVYLPVAIPELLGQNAVTEEELGQIGAYISATFLYGWMIGGLLSGPISDKFGRVGTLAVATGLYGLGTLLTMAVTSIPALLGLRFMTGMGVGGVLVVSTVYISEIWDAKTRPVILGILAVSFPIGIVTTGSLNLLFSNWRDAFGLGIVPLVIAALVYFVSPESGSWKDHQSANDTRNGMLSGVDKSQLLRGMLVFGSVLIGLWGIFSWLPTWVQTLLPAGSDGQKERGLTMVLLGMGGIVGGVLSGFLIRAFGSRITLMGTFACSLTMCLVLFLTNNGFSTIVYFEMAALALCFGISQGALSTYIPGLFPVSRRATATGLCFNVGRFFTATAVFFIGALVATLGGFGHALLVFSLSFFIAFIVMWTGKAD